MKALLILAATTVATGFGTRYDDDWPPMRFRGIGTVEVQFATQGQIDRICGKAPKGLTNVACNTDDGRVILPDPCTFDGEYAKTVCHELSHKFGNWPADHPR